MGAADKRLSELLDRWLESIELHTRYLDLDDAAYAAVQEWPRHQRPTKWVIDLARTRLLELKRQVAEREARNDEGFADALELMSFLTTLLGSEHIERFVPLATPRKDDESSATTVVRPRGERRASRKAGPARPAASKPAAAPKARPAPAPTTPREEGKTAPAGATRTTGVAGNASDRIAATVIADAVRFLNWGREWPQLAGLIARLADRPPEQEIWKILRDHRATIESQAKSSPG